jgi:hypothetical protein
MAAQVFEQVRATRKLDAVFSRRSGRLNFIYTGIKDTASMRNLNGKAVTCGLDRNHSISLPVAIPARGFTCRIIESKARV